MQITDKPIVQANRRGNYIEVTWTAVTNATEYDVVATPVESSGNRLTPQSDTTTGPIWRFNSPRSTNLRRIEIRVMGKDGNDDGPASDVFEFTDEPEELLPPRTEPASSRPRSNLPWKIAVIVLGLACIALLLYPVMHRTPQEVQQPPPAPLINAAPAQTNTVQTPPPAWHRTPVQPPPATIINNYNYSNVGNVIRSPGASVNVSVAGGNSTQQTYTAGGHGGNDGDDWKSGPCRSLEMGVNIIDTLIPGEIVEYTPPAGSALQPVYMDPNIPDSAIDWTFIKPYGQYNAATGVQGCHGVRLRINPGWRGGPIDMKFCQPRGRQNGDGPRGGDGRGQGSGPRGRAGGRR